MSESLRLLQDQSRQENWKRWGPYLPDRQWSTVREDYSKNGDAWGNFDHDMARSRTYRWGEDGLLGWCDRQARLCFSVALWNHHDPILKERLFGLSGPEGNHGEDVKECYYFLDSTPTHSYAKALYKYPQREFPYRLLRQENQRRSRQEPEFELHHTDALVEHFDCFVEYAKVSPDDTLIRLTLVNQGSKAAKLTVLPTCWFRNTWGWGRTGEGYTSRPDISLDQDHLLLEHEELGKLYFWAKDAPRWLFTENESNLERLFGVPNRVAYQKDAFHRQVIGGEDACNPHSVGTKAAAWFELELEPGQSHVIECRLSPRDQRRPFGSRTDKVWQERIREADEFYAHEQPLTGGEVWRQAIAGLFWSKKFYHYDVNAWLEGDPVHPVPPPQRKEGRNKNWACHFYARDVLLLPDAWEYPWFAAWDTAFHVIPLVRIDPELAKQQLQLFLREWYLHPNGQIPAYEWNFNDVNPPVHAWAAWRVYQADGRRDQVFLSRVFHKLLMNFTWWINQTDRDGNNVFTGGFLGLDNVGVFDRSHLPGQGELEQADATAWLAFYCLQMLHIALELASHDIAYEDVASKFFEHFVAITVAMNNLRVWDEQDGFFYDLLKDQGEQMPLKVRSMVGLLPLIAVDFLEDEQLERCPGFRKRLRWFVDNRPHLASHLEYQDGRYLLSIVSRHRLRRILRYMLDPEEFLSPFGIRSLSRYHKNHPYRLRWHGREFEVGYEPAESETSLFGGNSNWRGPIWFPVNYLLIHALEQYHKFYGDSFSISMPTQAEPLNLHQVADEIRKRLISLFLPDALGRRPSHQDSPQFKDYLWFHEYFDGDTGRGLGAIHQTGWTALVAPLLEQLDGAANASSANY